MKRFLLLSIFLIILTGISIYIYEHYFRFKKNQNELILFGNVDVRQVDISFRVAGQVAEMFFEEGDLVPKGSLMAVLSQSPYDSQAREARANVNALKASLSNTETLLKRRRELIGDGGVSQEDLNNAQSSYDQLRAQLNSLEATLNISLDNLEYTKAYAPIEGIILTRIREPGTVVRETDPIYTLSILSPVWVRAFVDETHLGQVKPGMEVEITTDSPNGHPYVGKIGFISPVAEFTPKTVETTQLRTDLVYRLRIYIDKPDSGLRQGMPVTARIKLKQNEETERNE